MMYLAVLVLMTASFASAGLVLRVDFNSNQDGGGDSLTRIDPDLYGNDPNNWDPNTPTPGS